MNLSLLYVDAFANGPFTGNPAGVVPLEAPIDDGQMQAIAAQNNLSETAFTVPIAGTEGCFALRWFTPAREVDLCGHATLGAAAALRDTGALEGVDAVRFSTKSGELVARFAGDGRIEIDLPVALSTQPTSSETRSAVERAIDVPVEAVFTDRYVMAVLGSEAEVRAYAPDGRRLTEIGAPLILTAPADAGDVDFVSRFFAPTYGVFEDPVTGSAHCQLTPYWASRLDRHQLEARQVSARGGELTCTLDGDRVRLLGGARVYLRGTIDLGME